MIKEFVNLENKATLIDLEREKGAMTKFLMANVLLKIETIHYLLKKERGLYLVEELIFYLEKNESQLNKLLNDKTFSAIYDSYCIKGVDEKNLA